MQVIGQSVDAIKHTIIILNYLPNIAIQIFTMVISNGHLAVVRIDYDMKNSINSAHMIFFHKDIRFTKLLQICR